MIPDAQIRDVPRHSEGNENGGAAAPKLRRGELLGEDVESARRLANLHLEIAAELPLDSPVRALVLRCGSHWARLGGLPRQGLRPVPPPEHDRA